MLKNNILKFLCLLVCYYLTCVFVGRKARTDLVCVSLNYVKNIVILMLIMLKMCIFDRFFINIVSFKLFIMQLKISKEKIKSLSVEDFLENVISRLVEHYSLAEIVSSPRLWCITLDDFNEVFVKIATKDALIFDVFADIISYCNFYFGTKRATVIVSGSSVHNGVVLYTVILFKDVSSTVVHS